MTRRLGAVPVTAGVGLRYLAMCLLATVLVMSVAGSAMAQSFRFSSIQVQGNQRIEDATVLSFGGLVAGRRNGGRGTVGLAAAHDDREQQEGGRDRRVQGAHTRRVGSLSGS